MINNNISLQSDNFCLNFVRMSIMSCSQLKSFAHEEISRNFALKIVCLLACGAFIGASVAHLSERAPFTSTNVGSIPVGYDL